ncbi:CFAP61 [Symbiodinium sp. CCMP2456]|nr:CFAP61 [Symbiodinium sp. CCMP2456]
MHSEEGLFVNHPNSPSWLSNMPQHTKDVFCVNMFCLDQAYQTQALDFLLPAFSLFPDKDYCIITQPHTAPNSPLLNAFSIVPPQPQNTFGHVLFLIHRAALLGPPQVSLLKPHLLESVKPLLEVFEEETQKAATIVKVARESCVAVDTQRVDIQSYLVWFCEHRNSDLEVFVAEFDEQDAQASTASPFCALRFEMPGVRVTGPELWNMCYTLFKSIRIMMFQLYGLCFRLRCCYHLDDYLLVEHHESGNMNKGHVRLLHWVLNPLFQNYTRRLLQGVLRICGKTALFVQSRACLVAQSTVASFCNIEEELPTEEDILEKERQELLRDSEQTKALSIVAKKLPDAKRLSETKIPVNARIVVVGASDCGLSFLESLLSIPHLLFNSLTLLAPGGLEYHHAHHLPLVAGTAAYSHQELRRIMLELRVRILDSRMVQIDRQQKCCILHDGSMLPYDYLVVATGLQDDSLHALKIQSMGVEHVTDGYRRVNGAMSAADPSIRDLLVEGGTLVKSLIWNPLSYAVVYGRSLNAYCVVQGLLLRQVPAKKIILVLPARLQAQATAQQGLSVDAFYEGDEVEKKIHHILETMGLKVYEGYRLLGIQQCTRDRLKGLILEDQNGGEVAPRPAEELAAAEREREKRFPAPEAARAPMGIMEDFGASPAGLPQKLLACRLCITADALNVDPDIFNSVHGNGLVYDGRLIVDHNFCSTDPGIFGAGSLCEFSRRFQRKDAARYLRHDGFNGREENPDFRGITRGGPVAFAMSSDSETELMPTLADAYRLALDHLQLQGLDDPPPVEARSAQLLVLLDLNGILVRCPPLRKRLKCPDQQVVEIRRPPGDNGFSSWAYTRPKEVRRLVDFLSEQPILWGIYSTMTRWNAEHVLRGVFQEAGVPIREASSRSRTLPKQSLEYEHPDHPAGHNWFWFFTQEDHHEYDPNSPPFPGHAGLSAKTPGVNSGHGQSLLTAGVINDVQEYLDARGFESRVCPILVTAAPKKTKLIRGLNLLIEDYDDQAVEAGKKTGLRRVETAVRTALRDLNAVGTLLIEANTAFLFRRRLCGLTVPQHMKDDKVDSQNHDNESPDMYKTIDFKIIDFLDPLLSAGDD